MVRAADRVWNDVVNIQALPCARQIRLCDATPLAAIAVSFAGRRCRLLPVESAPVMSGRSALPRWMLRATNIDRLPFAVATLRAERRFARARFPECLSAALTRRGHGRAVGPAILGAELRPSPVRRRLEVGAANRALVRDLLARRPNLAPSRIAAGTRAKPSAGMVGVECLLTNGAGLLHPASIADLFAYVADIKRRIAHVSGQDAPLFIEPAA